jgi:hypothetical protein
MWYLYYPLALICTNFCSVEPWACPLIFTFSFITGDIEHEFLWWFASWCSDALILRQYFACVRWIYPNPFAVYHPKFAMNAGMYYTIPLPFQIKLQIRFNLQRTSKSNRGVHNIWRIYGVLLRINIYYVMYIWVDWPRVKLCYIHFLNWIQYWFLLLNPFSPLIPYKHWNQNLVFEFLLFTVYQLYFLFTYTVYTNVDFSKPKILTLWRLR